MASKSVKNWGKICKAANGTKEEQAACVAQMAKQNKKDAKEQDKVNKGLLSIDVLEGLALGGYIVYNEMQREDK